MSTQAARAAYFERRRSIRFPVRYALMVCGDGGRLQELVLSLIGTDPVRDCG